MADPGVQLLSLIEARVAKGADRHAARAAVFRQHSDLVRAWHHCEGQDEPEPPRPAAPTHDDPGSALLALASAYERDGSDWLVARQRACAEHPAVFQAYCRGELIPKAPVRPRLPGSGTLWRVWADEMIEGKTYLHRCSDSASGGGIFEVMGA